MAEDASHRRLLMSSGDSSSRLCLFTAKRVPAPVIAAILIMSVIPIVQSYILGSGKT